MVEAELPATTARPHEYEGVCMLRFSSDDDDHGIDGDAVYVDMVKNVECGETAITPYGASYYYFPASPLGDYRAYNSPAPAIWTSKKFVVSISRVDVAVVESTPMPLPSLAASPSEARACSGADQQLRQRGAVLLRPDRVHHGARPDTRCPAE